MFDAWRLSLDRLFNTVYPVLSERGRPGETNLTKFDFSACINGVMSQLAPLCHARVYALFLMGPSSTFLLPIGPDDVAVNVIHRKTKVSRKARGALRSSTGGARGDPIGGSQFAADRRPAVSHIMVACLPLSGSAQTFSGSNGAVVAISTAGSTTGRQPEEIRLKVLLEAGAADGIMAPSNTGGGNDYRSVGGRDFCVAVSGGLASVLELVQPLRHVGWAGTGTGSKTTPPAALHGVGKTREVLRMMRVPSTWRRAEAAAAAAIEERKDVDSDHNETVADDVDGEADEFMVMCQDGWFGWYQSHHRRFEVRSFHLATRHTTTTKTFRVSWQHADIADEKVAAACVVYVQASFTIAADFVSSAAYVFVPFPLQIW